MEIKVQQQTEENALTIALKGWLDSIAAPEAEQEVLPLIEDEEYSVITIDCTELDYIASSGLRLFFTILKNGKAYGARVILKNPNDTIRTVLESTGLASMFEFE